MKNDTQTLYARGVKKTNIKYLAKEAAKNGQTVGFYLNRLLDELRKKKN